MRGVNSGCQTGFPVCTSVCKHTCDGSKQSTKLFYLSFCFFSRVFSRIAFSQNIFQAEDIRKQLPHETAEFDDINSSWRKIMEHLNKDRNALKGTHHPGNKEMVLDFTTFFIVFIEACRFSLSSYILGTPLGSWVHLTKMCPGYISLKVKRIK